MHELTITSNIVALVEEKAAGRHVVRVKLEIGELAAVVPDSIRFCFDVCARGTVLEGANLEIEEIKPRGQCQKCKREFVIELMSNNCVCGSSDITCIAGNELKIKEMEIA